MLLIDVFTLMCDEPVIKIPVHEQWRQAITNVVQHGPDRRVKFMGTTNLQGEVVKGRLKK